MPEAECPECDGDRSRARAADTVCTGTPDPDEAWRLCCTRWAAATSDQSGSHRAGAMMLAAETRQTSQSKRQAAKSTVEP
jgi:hypothetical protein